MGIDDFDNEPFWYRLYGVIVDLIVDFTVFIKRKTKKGLK